MLRNELYKPWFIGEKEWGFEIIDGEFQGVGIKIDKIEFTESQDGNVSLEYTVFKQPEDFPNLETAGKDNPMFQAVIETIINDILREAVEAHKLHEQQTRNDDSTESDSK